MIDDVEVVYNGQTETFGTRVEGGVLSYALGVPNGPTPLMTEGAVKFHVDGLEFKLRAMFKAFGLDIGPTLSWTTPSTEDGPFSHLHTLTPLKVPDSMPLVALADLLKSTSFPVALVVAEIERIQKVREHYVGAEP